MGSKHSPAPGVHIVTGPDKANEASRIARGVKVGNMAPQSTLYTGSTEVKSAADSVSQSTITLKGAVDTWGTAEAAARKARAAVGTAVSGWDASYDYFVATAAKHCTTPEDCASLGTVAGGVTHNPLAVPLGVALKQDFKQNLLRILVHSAPGMKVVDVEISPDPVTATSWKLLDGSGARRAIPLPGKGTWWVRAASRTAQATSAYTVAVPIVLV